MNVEFLKRTGKVVPLAPGEIYFNEGDRGEDMAFLLKGSVELVRRCGFKDQYRVAIISPGEFLGEMTLFLDKPRSATAIALEECVLVALDKVHAMEYLTRTPENAITMIKTLCRRLDTVNNQYQILLHMMRSGQKAGMEFTPPPQDGSPAPVLSPAPAPTPAVPFPAPSVVSAPVEEPAPEAETRTAGVLFPAGHKEYTLLLQNGRRDMFSKKNITCPMCGCVFPDISLRASKLKVLGTDPDLRVRYDGIEPLYYEVRTCPGCFYSAMTGTFETALRSRAPRFRAAMEGAYAGLEIRTGEERRSFDVFAGCYLALQCAPLCFAGSEAQQAQIWLKILRLYGDAGDTVMEAMALEKARQACRLAFERVEMDQTQQQKMFYIMGALALKAGDLREAKQSFFKVKTDKQGLPAYREMAEDRLEEIRESAANVTE